MRIFDCLLVLLLVHLVPQVAISHSKACTPPHSKLRLGGGPQATREGGWRLGDGGRCADSLQVSKGFKYLYCLKQPLSR